jgi:hypothetical protein
MGWCEFCNRVGDSMQNEAEEGKKLAHKGFFRETISVVKQLIA